VTYRLTTLIVLATACLVAACTAGRGSSPAAAIPATVAGTAANATPSAPAPTPTPRAATRTAMPAASASPVSSTRYTADDERIATLITTGVAQAIPELRVLNKTDPSKQVAFFEPVGTWIAGERAGLAGLTPSTCTAPAVTLYVDALKQYDTMRKKFLAWKDWGAHGHAFSPGAPLAAVRTLQDALAELDAHCAR
jgi:hypothetical protein